MTVHAIIGGTGLTQLTGFKLHRAQLIDTPYGRPSAEILRASMAVARCCSSAARPSASCAASPGELSRQPLGIEAGGRGRGARGQCSGWHSRGDGAGHFCVPHQIIDYTYGREQTFFEGDIDHVTHIDFSYPYDEAARTTYRRAGGRGFRLQQSRCLRLYPGPRLETVAEIVRMERDGCDIVGMTGMPEAALARELELPYACLALVVNPAAGKASG